MDHNSGGVHESGVGLLDGVAGELDVETDFVDTEFHELALSLQKLKFLNFFTLVAGQAVLQVDYHFIELALELLTHLVLLRCIYDLHLGPYPVIDILQILQVLGRELDLCFQQLFLLVILFFFVLVSLLGHPQVFKVIFSVQIHELHALTLLHINVGLVIFVCFFDLLKRNFKLSLSVRRGVRLIRALL